MLVKSPANKIQRSHTEVTIYFVCYRLTVVLVKKGYTAKNIFDRLEQNLVYMISIQCRCLSHTFCAAVAARQVCVLREYLITSSEISSLNFYFVCVSKVLYSNILHVQ